MKQSLRRPQVYKTLLRYGLDVLFDQWPVIGDFCRSMQAWVWNLLRVSSGHGGRCDHGRQAGVALAARPQHG